MPPAAALQYRDVVFRLLYAMVKKRPCFRVPVLVRLPRYVLWLWHVYACAGYSKNMHAHCCCPHMRRHMQTVVLPLCMHLFVNFRINFRILKAL